MQSAWGRVERPAAMKLKLAVTSDWDAKDDESVANGWYAWKNYVEVPRCQWAGCTRTNAVVTQMRFATERVPEGPVQGGLFHRRKRTSTRPRLWLDDGCGEEAFADLQRRVAKPQGKPLPTG